MNAGSGPAAYDATQVARHGVASASVDVERLALTISKFSTATPKGPAYGLEVGTTWGEFVHLLRQRREGTKDGPNFVPATFKPEADAKVRRLKENVTSRTAIVLDCEMHKETGEIPPSVAEIAARLEKKGWAAIVYTSHSHAPAAPRYRVVIPIAAPIAPDLPAVELAANALALAGVLDISKIGASSLFYLPSAEPGQLARHETVVTAGTAIDATWMTEQASALLAIREAEQSKQRANALAAAEARRTARIAAGLKPTENLIERIRNRLDLEAELLRHGYAPKGTAYLYPGSETGVAGVHVLIGQDGVQRVFSHHAGDPLSAGNLPPWCQAKAIDAVDVAVILEYGGDLKRGLSALARRFGIDSDNVRFRSPEPPPLSENEEPTGDWTQSTADTRQAFDEAKTAAQDVILSPSTPLISAKQFVHLRYTVDGVRALHHQNGSFFVWKGSHYAEQAPEETRASLYGFLESAKQVVDKGVITDFNPTKSKVANVYEATAAVAQIARSVRAPAWLDQTTDDHDAAEVIACENGLLHLPTRTLQPHTPRFFTVNALSFEYQSGAAKPNTWLNFLGEVWADDQESIGTLQEIFGLCLTANTTFQKCFLVVGPKRSGKGTIGRVLTQLIGPENVCGPTLSGLGTNFGLAPLIGKRVAIISDARLSGRADQSVIVERLLSITGEDSLTVDRKFREAWTGKLDTRFVVLTNEMPRLSDSSGAIAGRFVILRMTRSFFGKEDLGLGAKLVPEMPGILLWAIEGWKRLMDRGYFITPASSLSAQQELEDLGSPIGAFIRDRCNVGQGQGVRTDVIFNAWKTWCQEQGRDHPGNVQTFGRDLQAAVPGLETIQQRDNCGERHRYYEGLSLSPT